MSSRQFTEWLIRGTWLLVAFLLLAGPIGLGSCQDDEEEGGGDGPEETPPEKTCHAALFGLTTAIIPVIPKCLFGGNAINLKLNNIFSALPRIHCVLKCVFAELTVFTPEGVLDEVGALLWFQEAIPEYALPPIVEQAQPCLALASNFKPEQFFCQSYEQFFRCIFGTFVTGIGPFALDCIGTPAVAGFFGLLAFIVPRDHSSAGGEEGRRRLTTQNGTIIPPRLGGTGSFLNRMKARQTTMLRQQEQDELLTQARLNSLPNFANATQAQPQPQGRDRESKQNTKSRPMIPAQLPPSPFPVHTPTSSPALFASNYSNTYNYNSNRWRNGNPSSRSSNSIGRGRGPGFNLNFLFDRSKSENYNKGNYQNYVSQFHSNNSDSVVYQMDRITNLARSLQLLANSTAKFV